MSGVEVDVDTSTIEALDFAPPCEVHVARLGWNPCDKEAVWSVTMRRHCKSGQVTWLVCDEDLAIWLDPELLSQCVNCRALNHVGPRIIRTERIGA